MSKVRNIAVILAAGSGSRFSKALPKQFSKIGGLMLIEYIMILFSKCENIDSILVVSQEDKIGFIKYLATKLMITKPLYVVSGGAERMDSTNNALMFLADKIEDSDNIIIHDAARPFLSEAIINNCIIALKTHQAIDVVIDVKDTIVEVNEQNILTSIPNRSNLRSGQTPQAFKFSVLQKAFKIAYEPKNRHLKFTDDCGVVMKFLPEIKIMAIKGSDLNIKVTTKQDIIIADRLLRLNNQKFDFCEEDLKKLANKIIVVFGGNTGIGKELVELCKKYKAQAFPFSRSSGIDVTNLKDVKTALSSVNKKCGKIDYIINTSGILIKKDLKELSYKEIKDIININYLGSINIAKEGYKYLKKTKGGLLFYTSSSYTKGRASYSIYSSSKAAIVNLTQAVAEEWMQDKIKVNCINPQRTDTPMRRKNFGEEDKASLLTATFVAEHSAAILISDLSGQIVDVRTDDDK